jgi:integrase
MWQAEDHRHRRWLFPNSWRTGPIATNVLVRTFADAIKAADLPGGRRDTPHKLRHAYATRLFEKKVDTRVVQVLLEADTYLPANTRSFWKKTSKLTIKMREGNSVQPHIWQRKEI